ncbi:MAG TPA: hypothetical protein VGQ64_09020 [Candidatus Limnocylindrales bacterium]|nr:hypothetical protein [Candidatus Limnocylindrales bacterium]
MTNGIALIEEIILRGRIQGLSLICILGGLGLAFIVLAWRLTRRRMRSA